MSAAHATTGSASGTTTSTAAIVFAAATESSPAIDDEAAARSRAVSAIKAYRTEQMIQGLAEPNQPAPSLLDPPATGTKPDLKTAA